MRFLIVSKSISPEVKSILHAGKDFPEVEIIVQDIDSVEFDLSDFDVVYWRSATITSSFIKAVGRDTLLSSDYINTKFFNSFLINHPKFISKSVQQAHFSKSQKKIKTIPTFLVKDTKSFLSLLNSGNIKLPCIAKPNYGSKGESIFKIESLSDLDSIKDLGCYIFQNFIPNDSDYRVMVVGGVPVDVIRRRPTVNSTKQYLNNISQGGAAEEVDDIILYEKLAKSAEQVAATFNYQVCGVDFIIDSTTRDLYFMEINSVPQWELFKPALRADVGLAIVHYALDLVERKGNDLSSIIKNYYDRNIKHAGISKQFHYYSRTYLLLGDASAHEKLYDLRYRWLPNKDILKNKLRKIPTSLVKDEYSGKLYRKDYYLRHHKIFLYNSIFFKALFLESIYKESITDLIEEVDIDDLKLTVNALLADEEAIFALSTPACNFLYHVEHFFPSILKVNPDEFIKYVNNYYTKFSWGLDAKIYLFTHAVIGATRFYTKEIDSYKETYKAMISELESEVFSNFTQVTLDQKCEILVCARLLGITSALENPVRQEAEESLSEMGNYLVDTLNGSANYVISSKKSFGNSEHRNVLGLVAFSK